MQHILQSGLYTYISQTIVNVHGCLLYNNVRSIVLKILYSKKVIQMFGHNNHNRSRDLPKPIWPLLYPKAKRILFIPADARLIFKHGKQSFVASAAEEVPWLFSHPRSLFCRSVSVALLWHCHKSSADYICFSEAVWGSERASVRARPDWIRLLPLSDAYPRGRPMRASTFCPGTGRRTWRLPCWFWLSYLHQSVVTKERLHFILYFSVFVQSNVYIFFIGLIQSCGCRYLCWDLCYILTITLLLLR